MIVNVCPAAVSKAPPERIWSVLTTPEHFEEWSGAHVVSAVPPSAMTPGQTITLSAPGFGRWLQFRIQVRDMDPQHRWVDLVVYFPFGITNHEHITLTSTKEGGTLVRFN